MKRLQGILLLAFLSMSAFSQGQYDRKLEFLTDAVCELRKGEEASFNRVRKLLAEDEGWTPMNETGAFRDGECHPYDNVRVFGLNRMLTLIASDRKPVHIHGDMLNGQNESYDYSLYERSVLAGARVSYTVKGREGRQCFLIVPFDSDGGALSASITVNDGRPVKFQRAKNGILSVFLEGNHIELDTPLTITVTGGNRNQAFVLLNHNSRKR